MKDGSVFERRYPVSVTEEALKDKNSVAFKLTALETDPDNMMKQVLGNGYKENDYYSGYLTVYKEDGESDVYTFSRQESAVLRDAVEQDVREGNFDYYQLPAVYKDGQDEMYTNSFSISYYGKGNDYQTWDYYYNYYDYRNARNDNVAPGDASGNSYIQFGPKCENTVKALDGVDFCVKDQEFVAIIGKSGSGKSTLLHMLGGLDVPTEGEVLVEGKCLLGLKKEQLAIFRRRKIGFIFQNYNLVPDLNVYENVILPVELDGRKVDVEYVDGILELLGLSEKREALPGTLSGGQQQRAAIARALAAKPAIILADEPTGNLDSVTSHDVLGLLKMAARQFSQTLILITHDRDIAQLADRIVHIEDGKIIGDTRKGSDSYA